MDEAAPSHYRRLLLHPIAHGSTALARHFEHFVHHGLGLPGRLLVGCLHYKITIGQLVRPAAQTRRYRGATQESTTSGGCGIRLMHRGATRPHTSCGEISAHASSRANTTCPLIVIVVLDYIKKDDVRMHENVKRKSKLARAAEQQHSCLGLLKAAVRECSLNAYCIAYFESSNLDNFARGARRGASNPRPG
jgi:hypothetical protein